ncbi:insulinoma-associated protein 1a-like [Megalops cyprinoides]|uniref:insulinoma-associated protein 1a-like n=1 Tax=Megalops cyprinoides TaxID=118141 RepID=UPI001863D69E|nr:insulinoma-associated protein 1a-like [Megalops cyprinoides]
MPRGFLVKRRKKSGPAISYRVREDHSLTQEVQTSVSVSAIPLTTDKTQSSAEACVYRSVQNRVNFGGMPEAQCAPSLSPNRPVSTEYPQHYPSEDCLDRKLNSSSPIQAESFPEQGFTSSGSPRTFIPSLAEMTTKLGSLCGESASVAVKRQTSSNTKAKQTNPKKHKPSGATPGEKRQTYRDEVSTSPVLGLRINVSPDEDAKPRSNSPLGEFICQLCKERYSDPLTLAQHKCSRIVRVEYRCTECDKVFSCPANLASHRRWHKPKAADPNSSSPEREDAQSNTLPLSHSQTFNTREASTPSPHLSDSGSEEEMTFDCPQCCKKFRRQAYLRKHLALHNRQAAGLQQNNTHSSAKKARQDSLECGPLFLGRASPVTASAGVGEVYPCRFCGENFFSSPGLTRHINKCHPTETRQVILLSQTI